MLKHLQMLFIIGFKSIDIFIHFSVSKDSGLKFSPPQIKTHEYIIVEFHCLLSAMQWGFDSSSAVFVRFSAPQLGDFKYCYGPMEIISR